MDRDKVVVAFLAIMFWCAPFIFVALVLATGPDQAAICGGWPS